MDKSNPLILDMNATADPQSDLVQRALRLVCERCPRLSGSCYWAGTAAIAVEELHHRQSFDLDFHTRGALVDTRPILAEIRNAFPGAFELTQSPDEFGSGFQGVLTIPGGERITIEVLANYEDVSESDLTETTVAPTIPRVTLHRYLADKIQCVADRTEARDLVDIGAVLNKVPALEAKARQFLAEQDAAIVVERLLNLTDERIAADLAAYQDVSVGKASEIRDKLLIWMKNQRET